MLGGIVRCLSQEGSSLAFGRCIKDGALYIPSSRANLPLWRNIVGNGRKATTSAAVKYPGQWQLTRMKQFMKIVNTTKPSFVVVRFLCQTTGKLPYEKDFKITKNVLVFSNKNDRFYKLLSYFGAIQFVFWSYLGMFCYSSLRDVSYSEQEKADTENAPWWRLINLGKNKYKNGITLMCFSVGYIILFITVMYPLRAVQSLWLLKGGKSVGITTYLPFGKKQSLVAPLENLNCVQSRAQARNQIPLKIKGKWFFYLLDHKGVFHNTELFDYTIGLKRNIK